MWAVVRTVAQQQASALFVPKQTDQPAPIDRDEPGFMPIVDRIKDAAAYGLVICRAKGGSAATVSAPRR